MIKVVLTIEQWEKLEDLWFHFGNHGPRSTRANHKFIQGILECGEDHRNFYKPDADCIAAVDRILGSKGSSEDG